jgi:hypothetical protein
MVVIQRMRSDIDKQNNRSTINFTFLSLNKSGATCFEIEDYVIKVSSSVDYAFSFQPKPIEPFKNTGFMKKTAIETAQ